MYKKSKLVFGVGVNDADYVVSRKVNGKSVSCHFYQAWTSMLKRCYCDSSKRKSPAYLNCTVCPEWLLFSNFRKWMNDQDWRGKELDKDLLISGNRVYSPNACCFIDRKTNSFINDRYLFRGEWPLGVSYSKYHGKFCAKCSDPLGDHKDFIGYFNCPNEAHLAWKMRKHSISCKLAIAQSDKRAAKALAERYAP